MVEERVKIICKRKGVTLKYLASRINMTEAGLHRALKKKTLKVSTLEKIAEVLSVDVIQFFTSDDAQSGNLQDDGGSYQISELGKRVSRLEKELASLKEHVSGN